MRETFVIGSEAGPKPSLLALVIDADPIVDELRKVIEVVGVVGAGVGDSGGFFGEARARLSHRHLLGWWVVGI